MWHTPVSGGNSLGAGLPLRRMLAVAALAAALLSLEGRTGVIQAQTGDLGGPGPYKAGRQLVTVTRSNNSTFQSWIYYPATATGDDAPYDGTAAPYPAISFGHGYLTDPNSYRSTLEHLATWGYFVMATRSGLDLFPSHAAYAADLSTTLTYLEQQNASPGSWLYQQVDTARFGLSGHSMGGGASILAAAADARVKALANLAAAETDPSAEAAMANVLVPARLIAGDEDSIVPPSTTRAIALNGNPPWQFALIDGGWHCGFLDSSILGCDSGFLPRSEQLTLTRRLLAEFLGLYLQPDQDLWRPVWGPERNANPLVGIEQDPGLRISPSTATGTALAGTAITYTLAITNASPLATSLTLLAEDNAWSASFLPAQTTALDPGQPAQVVVEVAAPASAGSASDLVLASARRDVDGGTRAYATITTGSIPLVLDIARAGDSLALVWTTGTAACAFDLHRDVAPYLQPAPATLLATVTAPPYLDPTSGLGNAAVNHFYLLRARCGSSAVSSNPVGEFDFALAPGTP